MVLSLIALGGCATIVEGDDQTLSVMTDPKGAICELTRGGATVGVANPTPASVFLSKSKEDVSILCKKAGYFDELSTVPSSVQAMTFGNVLIGGVIGVVVDAASGAMHKYPTSITILLSPKSFPSASARDEFFAPRVQGIEKDAAAALVKMRNTCDSFEQDCDALANLTYSSGAAFIG